MLTDLSPLVHEGQLDLVVGLDDVGNLCGNPAMVLVSEPNPGPLAVDVLCHRPSWQRGVVVRKGSRQDQKYERTAQIQSLAILRPRDATCAPRRVAHCGQLHPSPLILSCFGTVSSF